ncbi:hypothetical protein M0813_15981 [Anaeramoeba flamelloides]|uniref:VHS domain-containing protein n=1 Tax=Anaeramoeba flamelloides TaxID=1746091 RepID=A0ABQ8Z188_9EUKA|nr:hypothetical protein M0813_15981 [Anaeramoeba flamelloides]
MTTLQQSVDIACSKVNKNLNMEILNRVRNNPQEKELLGELLKQKLETGGVNAKRYTIILMDTCVKNMGRRFAVHLSDEKVITIFQEITKKKKKPKLQRSLLSLVLSLNNNFPKNLVWREIAKAIENDPKKLKKKKKEDDFMMNFRRVLSSNDDEESNNENDELEKIKKDLKSIKEGIEELTSHMLDLKSNQAVNSNSEIGRLSNFITDSIAPLKLLLLQTTDRQIRNEIKDKNEQINKILSYLHQMSNPNLIPEIQRKIKEDLKKTKQSSLSQNIEVGTFEFNNQKNSNSNSNSNSYSNNNLIGNLSDMSILEPETKTFSNQNMNNLLDLDFNNSSNQQTTNFNQQKFTQNNFQQSSNQQQFNNYQRNKTPQITRNTQQSNSQLKRFNSTNEISFQNTRIKQSPKTRLQPRPLPRSPQQTSSTNRMNLQSNKRINRSNQNLNNPMNNPNRRYNSMGNQQFRNNRYINTQNMTNNQQQQRSQNQNQSQNRTTNLNLNFDNLSFGNIQNRQTQQQTQKNDEFDIFFSSNTTNQNSSRLNQQQFKQPIIKQQQTQQQTQKNDDFDNFFSSRTNKFKK